VVGFIVNGGDPGGVFHSAGIRLGSHRIRQDRLAGLGQGDAIGGVILAGDGVADRLSGNILDQQPGREQQREINDGKQDHQQDRGRQGEFDHALGTARALPEAFFLA